MEYDPNAPVNFTSKSSPEAPADAEAPEVELEIDSEEESEEPARVKYSRFKKYRDLAIEAQEEAEKWRNIASERQEKTVTQSSMSDVPSYWIKLYGDSEASKEAWEIQREQNETIKREAREEARQAFYGEREQQETQLNDNLETLDDGLDELSDVVGRDLSVREQSAVLDIIDEYTPTGRDGKYAGPPISFEKAWRIYEMQNNVSTSIRKSSRDSVASISGTRSQGEPGSSDKDESFNPSWGAVDTAIRKRS